MTARWKAAVRAAVVAMLVGAPLDAASAQGIDSQCKSGTAAERVTQDACQKALDLFTFLTPQMGAALAGGNAVLGEHSVLRGAGRASLGVRVNALRGRIPRADLIRPATTGAVQSPYVVENHLIPVPTVDGAFGLTRGFAVSGTNILGVDGLVNLTYVPAVTAADVAVTPTSGQLKLGFGLRVGLLEETIITPGVVVTVLRRDLPRVRVEARPAGDEITIDDFEVKTTSWRAVFGKNFGFVGLSAGAGQDTYRTSAQGTVRVTQGNAVFSGGPILAFNRTTRDNLFASGSLNLPLLRVVVEAGRTTGTLDPTFNSFGTRDEAVEFLSVGVRLRW